MDKIRVGTFWKNRFDGRIAQVVKEYKDVGQFKIIEEDRETFMSKNVFLGTYEYIPGYHTPLWRVLNDGQG